MFRLWPSKSLGPSTFAGRPTILSLPERRPVTPEPLALSSDATVAVSLLLRHIRSRHGVPFVCLNSLLPQCCACCARSSGASTVRPVHWRVRRPCLVSVVHAASPRCGGAALPSSKRLDIRPEMVFVMMQRSLRNHLDEARP